MRGFNAAVNSALREVKRQHRIQLREADKRRREVEKQNRIRSGAARVQEFNRRLDNLSSLHRSCADMRDWHSLEAAPPPTRPERSSLHEDMAHVKLKTFRPNLLHKIFNRIEKERSRLNREVETARERDELKYKKDCERFKTELSRWEAERELCRSVLDGNVEVYGEILRKFESLTSISHFGKSFEVDFETSKTALCRIYPHGEEIIPKSRPHLLKSGKISERAISKSDFYQLYMDYVCSASLRMVRELFALLPLNSIVLNVMNDHLNEATGHIDAQAILSIIASRDDLDRLEFNHIRPSATVEVLARRLSFQKTKGFKPIEPFQTDDVKRVYRFDDN